MKERWPMSRFLKMPDVQKGLDAYKKTGFAPDYKSVDWETMTVHSADPDLKLMTARFDEKFNNGELLVDKQHPFNPTRTLLREVEDTVARYERARAARGHPDTYDMTEINILRKKIIDEYQPFEYTKFTKNL
jgi:hypothetical protein